MNDARPSPPPVRPATPAETGPGTPDTDRTSPPAVPNTVTHGGPATASFAGAGPTPAELPAHIGRYAIRRLLGRGGMGAVYLAHDPELDRPVALKVPRLSGPDAEERFLREARSAAALKHENLCPVYDAGRADGVLYLVMAYIPGPTLTDVIRDSGQLPVHRACAIAAAVARGVAEAHRHGIVHRDLKPGNVLMDTRRGGDGEPVVTDFGLALRAGPSPDAEEAADARDTAVHDPRLTRVGALIGTPAYMPPEQVRGELDRVGPTADVYALGAILFEMLTGAPPFRGSTVTELVRGIETTPVPTPSAARPGLPAGLDSVVRKSLAKNPGDRFPSMDAFATALAPYLAPVRPRRRIARALLLAAVALLLLAAGTVLYIRTDNGVVEVRINDPSADVKISIDGNEIQVTDGTGVTKVRAGDRILEVKGPGYETETRLFKVTRGDKVVLEIELKPKPVPVGPKPPDPSPPVPAVGFAALGRDMGPWLAPPKVAIAPPPHEVGQDPAARRARLAQLLATGQLLIRQNKYLDLAPIVDEALAIDPESPGALALRATLGHAKNDIRAAKADIEAALKLNPETFQALLLRSYFYTEEGKYDEAIADATVAARVDPGDPVPWNNRAYAYFRKGEYRQAIADATLAEKARKTDTYIPHLLTRGSAYACLGEYEKAVADFDLAEERFPLEPRVYAQRSAVYVRWGKTEKADADWEAAQLAAKGQPVPRPVIPLPPKPVERKKLTAAEQAELDRLLTAFRREWYHSPPAVALKTAETAVQLDPTCAAARGSLACSLVLHGRYKEALDQANKAIQLDPEDAWAYTARGAAKNYTGDPAGGIADLTIALRIDPSLPNAWDARGYAYLRRAQYRQAIPDLTEALRLFPASVRYQTRGTCYLHIGDYEKALHDYEAAARLTPLDNRVRMMCSALKSQNNDLDGARRDRDEAIKLGWPKDARLELPRVEPPPKLDPVLDPGAAAPVPPKPAPDPNRAKLAALLARGKVLLDQGRVEELGKIAEQALTIDPESPTALAFRAGVRLHNGEFVDAKLDALAAIKLNPETPQAYIVLSSIYADEGKFDEALVVETIAVRLDPKNPWSWTNRASSFLNRKHYRLALADATVAIDMKFPMVEPLLTRAGAYGCLGEYEKALADFAAAEKHDPNSWHVYDQRSALYDRMENPTKEKADWARAVELGPPGLRKADRIVFPLPPKPPARKKLTPAEKVDFDKTLEAAEFAWAMRDGPECLKQIEEACRIDPTSTAARALRAKVYLRFNRFKDAATEAAAVLALDPTVADAYFVRGVVRISERKLPAAIADLTVAAELDPKNQLAWSNRSFAFTMLGYPYQGLADAEAALRLAPDDPQALVNRGAALAGQGEYQAALKAYARAYQLGGPSPEGARVLRTTAAIKFHLKDFDGAKADLALAAKIDGQTDAPAVSLPPVRAAVKKDPEPEPDAAP